VGHDDLASDTRKQRLEVEHVRGLEHQRSRAPPLQVLQEPAVTS